MTEASPLHAFLSVLADHALLGRLFFASVEMAVLAGIVWLIIRIRRRASPRLCSILWLLVMAKALVALAIGAPLAIIRIHPPEPAPFAHTYEPNFDYEEPVPSLEPETALPLVTIEPGPTEAARPARWSFSWKWSAAETISGAWIIGAILVGLYAALNRVRLHRLVSRAMPAPAGIIERYGAAVKHLRVKRPPRLRVTQDLESPALVGTLHPAILLPAWMTDEPNDAQLGWSLRHELTHWRLGDPLADFVRQLARILFFFHPVTWWASRKWEESAELACDRVVVNTESEAENYAGELYQILAQIHGRRMRPAMGGLFATRTQIGRRIAALLRDPLKSPARLSVVAVVCVLTLATVSLAVGGAFTGTTTLTAEDTNSELLLDRVREAIEAQDSQIVSLLLESDVYLGVDSFKVDLVQEKPMGHYTYARRDDKRYWRVNYLSEQKDRVVLDEETVFDGTTSKLFGRGREPYGVITYGPPSGAYEHLVSVPTTMPIWSKGLLTRLREDELTLLPHRRQLDGALCYVLVGKASEYPNGLKYELWVDPETGFMPRQVDEISTVEPKELTRRVRLLSYEEIEEGVWFPKRVEEEGHQGGNIFTRNLYIVASLAVNKPVAAELFEMDFPPGTRVRLRTTESSKTLLGESAEELDVAEWVDDAPTSIASLAGKAVAVVFWDSSEEACAPLLPLLNRVPRDYSQRYVEIISVHSADADVDALKTFISDNAIKFRVAVDNPSTSASYKGATFEKYGVTQVPAVFILDAQGKVKLQDIALGAVEQVLLEQASTVSGHVVSAETGKPISEYELLYIRGVWDDLAERGDLSFRKVVDSDGRFTLGRVPAGDVTIVVRTPGYAKTFQPVRNVAPGTAIEDVLIALEPGMIAEGVVRNTKGEPVRDALIFLERRRHDALRFGAGMRAPDRKDYWPGTADGRTAENGSFRIDTVAPTSQFITVYHPDYNPITTEFIPRSRQRFTLRRYVRVEGRVTANGKPLADALVQVDPGNLVGKRTDGDGRYVIVKVAPGPATLRAWRQLGEVYFHRRIRYIPVVIEKDGITIADIDFFPTTSAIEGAVLYNGQPVPNMGVNVNLEAPTGERELLQVPVQSDGTYRVENIPPGKARFQLLRHKDGPMLRKEEGLRSYSAWPTSIAFEIKEGEVVRQDCILEGPDSDDINRAFWTAWMARWPRPRD
jgi:beta-lactamase regulating signal transducer with metallopeptidase domain